jgi:hypothetical protein
MSFKYYITSMMNGDITGTNDKLLAYNTALSEDDFVLDVENNCWILSDGRCLPIKETTMSIYEEDEEE